MAGDTSGVWDPDRAVQVVSNLLANAIEHGGDPIRVCLNGAADVVTLTVANAGPAIPPEVNSTLFQPFSGRSVSRAQTGLGLGLFIVHEIVRAHGATIDVASTVSDGTVFTICWPRGSAR